MSTTRIWNPRREFGAYLLGQLFLALCVLWLANTTWQVTLSDTISEGLGTTTRESGVEFVPFLSISAIVSIVALLGVIATGTLGRRVIGVVSALVAMTALITVFLVQREGILGWIILAGVLLAGLIATNLFEVVKSSTWPQLSGRYDRDSGQRSQGEDVRDPWKSLDGGIDPTLD